MRGNILLCSSSLALKEKYTDINALMLESSQVFDVFREVITYVFVPLFGLSANDHIFLRLLAFTTKVGKRIFVRIWSREDFHLLAAIFELTLHTLYNRLSNEDIVLRVRE